MPRAFPKRHLLFQFTIHHLTFRLVRARRMLEFRVPAIHHGLICQTALGRTGLSTAQSSGVGWLARVGVPVEGGRVPLLL